MKIESALAILNSHKPIAQKSVEWIAARKNLIAASEAGYLLGIRSCSSMINYIKAKCNLTTPLDGLSKLDSIRHGNIYEDVARAIYQSRHGVIVKEYGLITTSKNTFLGASPDGIVIQEHITQSGEFFPSGKSSQMGETSQSGESRIGRIVEIKNPYDFDPSDTIKPEYAIQILQQQYVLELPQCDFIKANIIGSIVNAKTASKGFNPYHDINDFLADIPNIHSLETKSTIANHNIPVCNLTHRGTEKGVIIHYNQPETGQLITRLYPLDTPYTKAGILEWIKTTKSNIAIENGICKSHIAVEYWYLAAYFEKTLEYDAQLFENIYLPRLELAWRLIGHVRQLQDSQPPDTVIGFIDTILKAHLGRPSAFYKSASNQEEICEILSGALKLYLADVKIIQSLPKTEKVKEKVKEEGKEKANRRENELIEYDF